MIFRAISITFDYKQSRRSPSVCVGCEAARTSSLRTIMRNLFHFSLVLAGIFTLFSKTRSVGENPNRFNSKARQIETYSSRYDMPTNDPSLVAKLPFTFGYRFTDDYGTLQTREEKTDPNGSKTGSYSFVDATGTYRHVDYIADSHGFRATVKTNEPGTLPAEPADVTIQVENNKPFQRNVRHSPPQLEYSNHIFSRYNYSSNNYGQRTEHPVNPLQGVQNPSFYEEPFFGGNPPPRQQQLSPQNDQGYPNNGNYYHGPQYPPRQPLRSVFLPEVDLNSQVGYPKVDLNSPVGYPKVDLNSPVGYPKVPGLDPEEFFNDPNLNPGYVFGDKIANSGYNNKPEYSLLPPAPQPPAYPKRQRQFRPRPKPLRHQYKIHTPRGFENNPDLPLYMDK